MNTINCSKDRFAGFCDFSLKYSLKIYINIGF